VFAMTSVETSSALHQKWSNVAAAAFFLTPYS
jgi:hypothetical protein